MSVDLHEIVNKNLVSIFLRATVCHLAKEGKKGNVFERKGFTSKLKPCFFLKLPSSDRSMGRRDRRLLMKSNKFQQLIVAK